MKFLLLNGPSCAGKSAVVGELMERRERLYKLSYDGQKWFFSGYHPDTHFKDAWKVVLALAETICPLEYDIVCDSALFPDFREKLLAIPRKYGYAIVEVNLEAPYSLLEKRFDARVKDAAAKKSKTISNTSKVRFRELYELYEKGKNPAAKVIRTDTQSAPAVTEEILKLL